MTGVWPTGPDVVFTAMLPPGAPPDIYWRAVAYDTWSSVDRGWLASDQTVTPVDAGSSILDVVSEPHSVDADKISVSIVPKQAGTIVVAPGLVVTVDQAAQIGTSGPGGPLVQVALSHPSPSYRVTAIDPLAATATQLAGAGRDYPSDIRERYAGTPDPREFGPASTAFIRAIDDVAGDDPYLVATRIVDAFQDPRFTYATDTRNVDCGADGFTECFLRVKRGYCMYYATAMVMLLRHEGIPARIRGGLPSGRARRYAGDRQDPERACVGRGVFPSVRLGDLRSRPRAEPPRSAPGADDLSEPEITDGPLHVRRAVVVTLRRLRSLAADLLGRELAELPTARRVAQLAQRMDSIWRIRSRVRPNSCADLLERSRTPVIEAEPKPDDPLLAALEAVEDAVDLLPEQLARRRVERRDGASSSISAPSSVSPSSPIGVSSEIGVRP